jgi:glycosyltransferase involved in cell wall biosynthesis
MASGCPVVSTSIGAEGLGAAADEIRVADDSAGFAREVVTLIREPATRRALALRARRFAESNFDWPAIAGRLFEAYGWNGRAEAEGPGA